MANTYTQINIHTVFAVKGRENIITDKFADELYKYISGILKQQNQYPLAVNGYKDHVHVFFEMNTSKSLGAIMDIVKASSSKWINDRKFVPGRFEWQKGYGGFSYSRSQRDNVIKYIMKQKEHHSAKSFKEEYLDMLKNFEIDYNDIYLFEFYE